MAADPLHRSLREWPSRDRIAIERALDCELDDEIDLTGGCDCQGMAAHWSTASREHNIRLYTFWLRFLGGCNELDITEEASKRATKTLLLAYLKQIGDLSSQSRATYINGIVSTLAVIDPTGDRTYISTLARRLSRLVEPSRDKRDLLVAPSDMFYAGISLMKRTQDAAKTDTEAASAFCDGLMMSAMVCKALRRKNFSTMLINRHVRRNIIDAYEVHFSANEMKGRRRVMAQWSKMLTPFVDLWINFIRLFLLKGRNSDAMWITSIGTDMTAKTFYRRFCKVTENELLVRINPHFTRKIVGTGVAIARPDLARSIGHLLDHTSDQSAVYNLADQLSASKCYLEMLDRRRQQALAGLPATTNKHRLRRS